MDELRHYPSSRYPHVWCHIASDESHEEIHEFAARLGLKREWFHKDHYDIPARKRGEAVRMGAMEVSWRILAKRRVKAKSKREPTAPLAAPLNVI